MCQDGTRLICDVRTSNIRAHKSKRYAALI
jgi:hypothetical protein